MGVFSNKIDREQLKPGDHIYSWREAYIYAHHGIYFGDGMVIHFTRSVDQEVGTGTILDRFIGSSIPRHDPNNPCPRCGDQSKKEGVISSCLDCFLYGGNLYLFEYGVSPAFFLANRGGTCTRAPSDPTKDVLHRASILLKHGFGDYDVFKKNCENFAIYCKTGLLVCSGQAASLLAAVDTVFSAANWMNNPSPVSRLAVVGRCMYSYCANRMASDIGRCGDASKIPVEKLIASLGVNEAEKTAEVPVERPIDSPNLNEQEKTAEVPGETITASPGLNEAEKTAKVPVESLKASPGLNELEKTTKTANENQHWLNRGFGNRGGDRHSIPPESPQPDSPPGFVPAHLAPTPSTPQVLNDKSWFPDSGATNLATVDRENLVQRSKYNGSQGLFVENGTEAERRKKEEAERLAKLDEIAEKQRRREREVEEKERQRREALLGRGTEPASRRSEPPTRPPKSGSAAPAAAAGPAPGKYVPRFKREKSDGRAAPPPETDRWTKSSSKPDGDRWRSNDRRPAFRSSWRSNDRRPASRNQRDR